MTILNKLILIKLSRKCAAIFLIVTSILIINKPAFAIIKADRGSKYIHPSLIDFQGCTTDKNLLTKYYNDIKENYSKMRSLVDNPNNRANFDAYSTFVTYNGHVMGEIGIYPACVDEYGTYFNRVHIVFRINPTNLQDPELYIFYYSNFQTSNPVPLSSFDFQSFIDNLITTYPFYYSVYIYDFRYQINCRFKIRGYLSPTVLRKLKAKYNCNTIIQQ